MDLETARGLRQELWSFIDETLIPTREDGELGEGRERVPELAIGFAPTGRADNVHVAIRAASEEELPVFVVDEIKRRAKNQIDIRYTGSVIPLVAANIPSVDNVLLTVGAGVAHYRCGAGSLGFFARRENDSAVGIVSNNHVIAATDQGDDSDEIVHVEPGSDRTTKRTVIAHLCGKYPRLRRTSARLDCAFAPLAREVHFDPAPAGQPLMPNLAAVDTELTEVSKIGRTTGQTYGRVTAFELDRVRVTYPFGRITFNGQIEIDAASGAPFSRPGDSGALVFTVPDRQPLGLIFGGSLRGGASGMGLTFANPIRSVLETLGVTLIT